MRPESGPWDAKEGAKRWASVLDGEAKPLTDAQLAERSAEFERGYREFQTESVKSL